MIFKLLTLLNSSKAQQMFYHDVALSLKIKSRAPNDVASELSIFLPLFTHLCSYGELCNISRYMMPMLIAINKDYISRKLVINHWLLVIKTSEHVSELPIVLIPSPTSPIPFAICATTGSNLDKMVIQMKDRTNGRTDDRADGQDSRTYIRTDRVKGGTAKR